MIEDDVRIQITPTRELDTDSASDSADSLDPPFQIHGIQVDAAQVFNIAQPIIDHDELQAPGLDAQHLDSDSDADAPSSIQFETRPLLVIDDTTPGRLHYDLSSNPTSKPKPRPVKRSKNKYIETWRDVEELDDFLKRIYDYYTGRGILCILCEAITNLLIVAFVVVLSVFLFECIDYSLIHQSKKLEDILIGQCIYRMRWLTSLTAFCCLMWWLYQFGRILLSVKYLIETRNFFQNVLEISDNDLQSMIWNDVISKIKDSKPGNVDQKKQINANVIANRIMRKDNYLIAMLNKDILDLSIPMLGKRQWMTQLMQDYLAYGIFSFIYDSSGNFKKRFLKASKKTKLVQALQNRFQTMATITLLCSPFLFLFLIIRSFLKMSEEYRQNPSLLGARWYSPEAAWKLREFNEVPHLFQKRLMRSYEPANRYMQQFPNHLLIIIGRFISFISGSFATVLLIITLFEEDFQQGFEITSGKSAFFYIGLFGSIMAVTRGLASDNVFHEPQRWMNELILDTHYNPSSWRDRAHDPKVRDEFAVLFGYKIVILLRELLSVLIAPFILYYSLPSSAPKIIDFIREFTVHVDSIGYVCSFAIFDFEKHGNVQFGALEVPRPNHMISKNGKMEYSFMNFKANYPDWDPGFQGSQYISKVLSKRPLSALRSVHPLNQTITMHSGMPSSSITQQESIMAKSVNDDKTIGVELIGILDAFYDANKRL